MNVHARSPEVEAPSMQKVANALYVDATAKPRGVMSLGPVGVAILVAKRIFGGLWVGGTAKLYSDRLVFEPNVVNEVMHSSDLQGQGILLEQVSSVQVKSGVLTNIVEIQSMMGVLSLRCFGAAEFAAAIDEARQLRQRPRR